MNTHYLIPTCPGLDINFQQDGAIGTTAITTQNVTETKKITEASWQSVQESEQENSEEKSLQK